MQQDRFNKYLVSHNDGTTQIYVIDKIFISISIFILLLFFISIMVFSNGFKADKNFYVECKNPLGVYCENPLYQNYAYCGKVLNIDSQLCTQEFLVNGESIGTKPPRFLGYSTPLTILYMFIVLLINHLYYNRHFKFKKIDEVD